MTDPTLDNWDDEKPPVGLGGFLAIPLLHLVLGFAFAAFSVVMGVLRMVKQHAAVHHPAAAAAMSAAADAAQTPSGQRLAFAVLGLLFLLVMAAIAVVAVWCLLRMFRKRHNLPRLMTVWYALTIAAAVVVALQVALAPSIFFSLPQNVGGTPGGQAFKLTLGILFSGFWMIYFGASERVRFTFVR